jgi:ADP-ribose pyrophosphatase YjhB (NUDIX family)
MGMTAETSGRIVIFSSSKRLDIARAIQTNLSDDFDCAIWDQGVLPVSSKLMSSILEEVDSYDFAICVLSADTKIVKEDGTQIDMPNDNVLFELGVSIAHLGSDRAFTLVPRDRPMRLPAYVESNNNVLFRSEPGRNLRAQLGAPCNIIRERAKVLGLRKSASLKSFGQKIEFAGSLCFRIQNGQLHFLTVQSTAGRRTIPKGQVEEKETISDAALRYAHDEGGVVGHIFTTKVFGFRHKKANSMIEQMVAVKIIQFEDSVPPRAKFRDPQWETFEGVKVELMRDRTYEYAREVRDLFDSILPEIIEGLAPVRQAAALPYRGDAENLEVLLITSLNSRRWIIPKGNIDKGEAVADAAKREALEEAGVRGRVHGRTERTYSYERDGRKHVVSVLPLEVDALEEQWPDRQKRERHWFSAQEAADRATEEELKELILEFARGGPG